MLETVWQDVRYAVRLLRRTPGFAAVAVATLALGIGGSTTIFTVVDAVLLRPLSFAEPQRLVMIQPSSGSRLSPAYFQDWRLGSRTFQDMAGWFDVLANLTGRGDPLEVFADRVTPNFFAVLGTPAVLGRTFTVGPSLSDVQPEVILSHGFWQRHYGGDPSVVGQPITLDGESLTIIGVMPEGFTIRTNELSESRAEIWMPYRLVPGDLTGMGGILNVVGRLAPSATREQAQAEISMIARRIEEEHPSYSRDWGISVVLLHEATVKDVRLRLLVLFGGVAILLLIACVNLANLVLGRAATRQTELAIRLSLGASAGRLVRQLLTESFVLAAIGGVFGVLLAVWGTQLFVAALPAGLDLPRTREIGVDLRVLVFAFLVTLVTAIFFGLLPSMSSARSTPHSILREATSRGSSAGRNRKLVADTLIISEVALALILLAGAGLLGRSFWELSRVNPGFQAEQVLTLRTTLPASKYETDDRIRAFSGALLERIESVPGVRVVGTVGYLPMSRQGVANRFEIEGRPEARVEDQKFSWVSIVGGRYFEAMGIPLLRGRLPRDDDTEKTEPVVIIDAELARRYWGSENPVGARLSWTVNDEKISGEIIGVVGSVRWVGMANNPPATSYFWFPQDPRRQITIVARTIRDPIVLAGAIAAQVKEIDPNQPVAEIRAMREFVSADLAQPRFTMLLLGSFAAAALLLAAIGLYGVIAFGVAQRTREIGVRVALGAQYSDVLRMVMTSGMLLTGTGLAIGMATALALGRVVASLLYGVTPTDPITLMAVALLLSAVAAVAIYLPARHAARIDPLVALRQE